MTSYIREVFMISIYSCYIRFPWNEFGHIGKVISSCQEAPVFHRISINSILHLCGGGFESSSSRYNSPRSVLTGWLNRVE